MGKIGLALGGGGVTGSSHVGVVCALEEAGIRPDYLAGTSAGSVVAALYSLGYTGKELAAVVPKLNNRMLDYDYFGMLHRLIRRNRPVAGLVKGERLRAFLAELTRGEKLSAAKRPVVVGATDLRSATQVLFASDHVKRGIMPEHVEVVYGAPMDEAVMASLSIPGLFRPVRMGNRVLVDGGLMDNCPTAALKALGAKTIIAVDLVAVKPSESPFTSFSSILTRSMSVGLCRLSKHDSEFADIVLHPDVGTVGVMDFSSVSLCMEKGYEYTRKRMKDIKLALEYRHEKEEALVLPPPSGEAIESTYAAT